MSGSNAENVNPCAMEATEDVASLQDSPEPCPALALRH